MAKKRPPENKSLEFTLPLTCQPILDLRGATTDGANAAKTLIILYQNLLHQYDLDPDLRESIGYLAFAMEDHMKKATAALDALEDIRLEVAHA